MWVGEAEVEVSGFGPPCLSSAVSYGFVGGEDELEGRASPASALFGPVS